MPHPMFQKRHYIAIAKILHVHWLIPDATLHIYSFANTLSDLFEADNPLFDRDKFMDAVHGKKGVN